MAAQGKQPDTPVKISPQVVAGNHLPLTVFAGPCAMESRAHALECAAALKEIADRLSLGLVYKSSFDKANRTSAGSARGVGLSPRGSSETDRRGRWRR